MVHVKKEGIILQKTDHAFENEGVFNPAVIKVDETVHMFYRAVRKGNHSTIGYCRLDDPLKVSERLDKPLLFPEHDYETRGLEDPRIVKIDDTYYMSYTGYDDVNAQAALATSPDLKTFKKHGLIVPRITYAEFKKHATYCGDVNEKYFRQHDMYRSRGGMHKKLFLWDKNVIFFPRRINGKLAFLHRVRPGIQLVMVESLDELTKAFWENYFNEFSQHIVLDPKHAHEASYIGGGCPPIETPDGWVLIYHGVQDTPGGYIYNACAALLDLENPQKELTRLPVALFSPDYNWEQHGIVNNVVFPTGTALFGDTLYVYYGAADEHIACASLSFSALLDELLAQVHSPQTQMNNEINISPRKNLHV